MTARQKRALVLAGGFPQRALLQELRRRGYETLLADYLEHPVAEKDADHVFRVSTLDVPAIQSLAATWDVAFLITACTDQALLTVARVSEELGLPSYLDAETALRVTNKTYMKDVFRTHGIPTASFVTADHWTLEAFERLAFPVVVKPADANSSKGVVTAASLAELAEAFADAQAISRTSSVIVEEFLSGMEITVDAYVERGEAQVLAVSRVDKIPESGRFIIYRSVFPAPISAAAQTRVQSIVQAIAEAFHLQDTPLLVQMLVEGDHVNVVEFSARTGGGTKHLFLRRAAGFDAIAAVIDLTIGRHPHIEPQPPAANFMAEEYLYARTGTLCQFAGVESLLSTGAMAEFYCFVREGMALDGRVQSSGGRVAGFRIEAASATELAQKHETVMRRLQFLDPQGRDLLRRNLIEPLDAEAVPS